MGGAAASLLGYGANEIGVGAGRCDRRTSNTAGPRRKSRRSARRICGESKMTRKRAFVTGASRGIGKGIAITLAKAGFDVAITARTVHEGEAREHSSTVKKSDTSPLPGSLASTAEAMRAAGAEVLVLPADLTQRATLGAAANTVLERWGGVDLLVHNGRFIGPGHMDLILDVPVELLEKHVEGAAFAPYILSRMFLPAMIAQGGGTIVYITSGVIWNPFSKPAGQGGTSLAYSMSKAAGHAMAHFIHVEHAHQGVRSFNLNSGMVQTERLLQDPPVGFDASDWAPPEVIGQVVNWLATSPEADRFRGQCVEGQPLCDELGLLTG
jgi:NAD(P)-dependent dehydrogenase (short-subunit alcohol dehydrogenase family)